MPNHNLGVQLGVKLPTGQYGASVRFNDGPAAGTPLDASLQPGTGSNATTLSVGMRYEAQPKWAPQLQMNGFAQIPVYSDLVGYQVFPRYTVSVGVSYAF